MSQSTLAKKVGVTRQTIATIEKAKYYPSLELAFLISRVLAKKSAMCLSLILATEKSQVASHTPTL